MITRSSKALKFTKTNNLQGWDHGVHHPVCPHGLNNQNRPQGTFQKSFHVFQVAHRRHLWRKHGRWLGNLAVCQIHRIKKKLLTNTESLLQLLYKCDATGKFCNFFHKLPLRWTHMQLTADTPSQHIDWHFTSLCLWDAQLECNVTSLRDKVPLLTFSTKQRFKLYCIDCRWREGRTYCQNLTGGLRLRDTTWNERVTQHQVTFLGRQELPSKCVKVRR